MKKILILFLFLISFFSKAQTKQLTFEYDVAGNQKKRELCLDCPSSRSAKEKSELKEEDLEKFFPEDVISYYPNPVKEELYLHWELIEGNTVSSIDVSSMTGQFLKNYKDVSEVNNKIIPFDRYPAGTYIITLIYSNGEQKSIKIIKKQ